MYQKRVEQHSQSSFSVRGFFQLFLIAVSSRPFCCTRYMYQKRVEQHSQSSFFCRVLFSSFFTRCFYAILLFSLGLVRLTSNSKPTVKPTRNITSWDSPTGKTNTIPGHMLCTIQLESDPKLPTTLAAAWCNEKDKIVKYFEPPKRVLRHSPHRWRQDIRR